MERLEPIILRSLFTNEPYVRRVLPFLDQDYFLNKTERLIFQQAKAFIDRFNALPSRETLMVDLDASGAEADTLEQVSDYIEGDFKEAESEQPNNVDWLVERTEGWCQEKAVHNAVLEVVKILDGKNKKHDKEMIPELLKSALAVSFDPNVGHDYFGSADERYEFYHKKDARLPFALSTFNQATKNGIPNKTLNICLAGTNVGKSLFMCDLASTYLRQGKKVLYITLEMAEERIAERIDANLLDVKIDDLEMMSKDVYKRQIAKKMEETQGQLIIKEYPTASAHAGHFRHLLNELKLKKNFKPDAIFIDYLNICASGRMKATSDSMYSLVKSIAEELRGLAVEFDVPIWSATQMNRCLDVLTDVKMADGSSKKLIDVVLGDLLAGEEVNSSVEVTEIIETKDEAYEIETESGKKIICSSRHLFPVGPKQTLCSIETGLMIGDYLHVS